VIGIGLAAWASACGQEADAPRPLSPEEIQTIRDAVATSLGQGLATGYSIAVWREGRVIYRDAFGTRDEQGNAATPDTQFLIGSDTKKLTAIGLLQQVQAGALTLDQSVADVAPGLSLAASPEHLRRLTIDALLSHRSGLFDYTPWTEAPADEHLAAAVRGRFAENEYPMMPPGIAYNYSNPDYSIAGFLNELLDGRHWADIVTADVFVPLGMGHTYARRDDMLDAESDVASGYGTDLRGLDTFDLFDALDASSFRQGWVTPLQQVDDAFTRPAGLVWSTAADQARLLGFLVDGNESVLSEPLREEMTSAHSPYYNHLTTLAYGYGLFAQRGFPSATGEFYDVPYLWHGGSTETMTSASLLLPEQRVAVSVLANGNAEDLDRVARAALTVAARQTLPPPSSLPAPPPPADGLPSYAGSYVDPSLGELTLGWDGQNVTIDVPALTALGVEYDTTLQPVALDLFTFSLAGELTDLSFYDGEDGTRHQYGVNRDFVLTRQ
jgi:CubicO group peptidase (beta-lactamase class C family)